MGPGWWKDQLYGMPTKNCFLQYEREKQLRKGSDQKLLEIEDSFDGERKEATVKIDSLTSIVKMFELKSKNSQDHSNNFLISFKGCIIVRL